MKILILTSINPVLAGDVYRRASSVIPESDETGYLCLPFFAEMKCMRDDKAYLPTFFSMAKALEDTKLKNTLFNKKNIIVIGNCYKSQEFDIIITFDDLNTIDHEDEGVFFDTYLNMVKYDENMKDFADMVDVDNMYTPADAEIIIPTADHLVLFLKGAIKDGPVK